MAAANALDMVGNTPRPGRPDPVFVVYIDMICADYVNLFRLIFPLVNSISWLPDGDDQQIKSSFYIPFQKWNNYLIFLLFFDFVFKKICNFNNSFFVNKSVKRTILFTNTNE